MVSVTLNGRPAGALCDYRFLSSVPGGRPTWYERALEVQQVVVEGGTGILNCFCLLPACDAVFEPILIVEVRRVNGKQESIAEGDGDAGMTL